MGVDVDVEVVAVAVEGFTDVVVGVGVGIKVGVGVGGIGGGGSGDGDGRHFFLGDRFLNRACRCFHRSCICLARLDGDETGGWVVVGVGGVVAVVVAVVAVLAGCRAGVGLLNFGGQSSYMSLGFARGRSPWGRCTVPWRASFLF